MYCAILSIENCVMDCPLTRIVMNFNLELADFKFITYSLESSPFFVSQNENASTYKINVFWKILTWCNQVGMFFFWTDFDLSRDLARLQQIRAAIWHWKHSFFFLKKEISCSYAQNHARRLCFALAKRNKTNIRYICIFLIFINKI